MTPLPQSLCILRPARAEIRTDGPTDAERAVKREDIVPAHSHGAPGRGH